MVSSKWLAIREQNQNSNHQPPTTNHCRKATTVRRVIWQGQVDGVQKEAVLIVDNDGDGIDDNLLDLDGDGIDDRAWNGGNTNTWQ